MIEQGNYISHLLKKMEVYKNQPKKVKEEGLLLWDVVELRKNVSNYGRTT